MDARSTCLKGMEKVQVPCTECFRTIKEGSNAYHIMGRGIYQDYTVEAWTCSACDEESHAVSVKTPWSFGLHGKSVLEMKD